MKRINLKKFLFAVVMGFTISCSQALDYETLSKPIPTQQKGKIEVLEFFSYTCSHCRDLDPVMENFSESLPSDVYVRREHVDWDPQVANLLRITSAVNMAQMAKSANPVIFDKVFSAKTKADIEEVLNPQQFAAWVKKQGAWGQAVGKAFESPANIADASRMSKLTRTYAISSTPQIIVDGRYRLMTTGLWEVDMQKLRELIAKVRKEKGLPMPKVAK